MAYDPAANLRLFCRDVYKKVAGKWFVVVVQKGFPSSFGKWETERKMS